VNGLDYAILVGSLLAIAVYALWSTRGKKSLSSYLKGSGQAGWLTIGLSVMATQASAVTFLSTPGQGFESGLGFVQNYFGAPLALIVTSIFFLPIYRRLKVYTAYEYLGRRFDAKTRLLGATLFLIQRGLGAGITIYAPAIVLSTVMGWRLDATIICSGLVVVAYTVAGGCDAVSLTQKYQIGMIFVGMIAAFGVLLAKLPPGLGFSGALTLAGGFHKLEAVDFSPSLDRRYTAWSGLLGGAFLAMSYFGTDQSQVQRYLGGSSLRESRLGLMFNAVFKIPMQFFILLLGVLIFVFYQFERPPVFFNRAAWNAQAAGPAGPRLRALAADFDAAHAAERTELERWVVARRAGRGAGEAAARTAYAAAHDRLQAAREETKVLLATKPGVAANDSDYVFIAFILDYLPHGLIGLLVTAFFAAALSSKAGELNALGSTTTVDLYRHLARADATDAHYVVASKCFTAFWGLVAIGFALFAHLSENLIQAVNILGSLFYGVVLGIFLVAFFLRRVGGTAVFWAALGGQVLVFALYLTLSISYLWYNVIGCAACMGFAVLLQAALDLTGRRGAPAAA
jgi:SSS family solute:Na+ symporter